MKYNKLIPILLVFITGCAQVHHSSNYNINKDLRDKTAKLKLSDGTSVKGENILINGSRTSYYKPRLFRKGINKHTIPTSSINKIVFVDRGRGAAQGFSTFMLAGVALGVYGYTLGDDAHPHSPVGFDAEEKFMLGNIVGIILGFTVGCPIGAIIGSRDVYVIN